MPLEDLHPHPLNPYGVRDDSAMQELVGSVKENGIIYLFFEYFNPRSREGSDYIAAGYITISTYFNPRSREGSDEDTRTQGRLSGISIHAPARGATR